MGLCKTKCKYPAWVVKLGVLGWIVQNDTGVNACVMQTTQGFV